MHQSLDEMQSNLLWLEENVGTLRDKHRAAAWMDERKGGQDMQDTQTDTALIHNDNTRDAKNAATYETWCAVPGVHPQSL